MGSDSGSFDHAHHVRHHHQAPLQKTPCTQTNLVSDGSGPAAHIADDLINPPELGILEREMKRVPKGRAIIIPLSDKTRGHGSHTIADLWKDQLVDLLKRSQL